MTCVAENADNKKGIIIVTYTYLFSYTIVISTLSDTNLTYCFTCCC